MTEYKFTSGPWCADEPNGKGHGWRAGPAWLGVCAWSENTAANARLIAAAPDLLEALQEFATQHHCGCGNPTCNDCARDRMAADAIAKATGDEA